MSSWRESCERHLPPFASVFGGDGEEKHRSQAAVSPSDQTQQPKKQLKQSSTFNTGHWTEEEHEQFVEAVEELGTFSAVAISHRIPTRSVKQIQSHIDKFLKKKSG